MPRSLFDGVSRHRVPTSRERQRCRDTGGTATAIRSRRMVRRVRSLLTVALVTALALALGAQPAEAAVFHHPGHPMNINVARELHCTGSWAIRGESGMFFLTAGHCFALNQDVNGETNRLGRVRRNDHGRWGGMDALLVEPAAGVDARQLVVDTNNNVIGRTVGTVPNNQMPAGMFVNKMGRKTGWTWGQLDGSWYSWTNGEPVRCGIIDAGKGDSGGPVFTRDASNRAWAAGIIVGAIEASPGRLLTCFITMDHLLQRFGAWLPVFSATGARDFVGPSANTTANPPADQLVEPLRRIAY